jgi:PAS domain S-box-containing protein
MNSYHPSAGVDPRLHLLAEAGRLLDHGNPAEAVGRVIDMMSAALGLDLSLCLLRDGEEPCPVASGGLSSEIASLLARGDGRDDAAILASAGMAAIVRVPLGAGGEIIAGRRDAGFSPDDLLTIEIVAGTIAMALGRGAAHEELRLTRSELEGALASSEITLLQLDAAFRSINEGIIITDLQGSVLAMNPAALDLLGFEDIEECNRHFDNYLEVFQANYLDSELVPVEEWPVQRIVRGESFTNIEVHVRRLDTGRSWIGSFSGAPVRNRDGEIILAAITIRDITAQKHGQRELKEAKRAAERANRFKNRFLDLLSHELRTPLMPVLTLAHLLESDPALPAHLRDHAEVIRKNVEVEASLIDDLLDLTLIDKGKLDLAPRPLSLHRLIGGVLDACGDDIARKQLKMSLSLDADRATVAADPLRMKQALRSLIKTVVNLAGKGEKIAIGTRDAERGVLLTISGSGRGMSPRLLRHMFGSAGEADAPTTTRFGGAGLSFAIARVLIELHGGSVGVVGEDDDAITSLLIELPTTIEGEEPEREALVPVSGGEALRVLVVEDHEDTCQVMRAMLDRAGYRVAVASSVAGAIDAASAGEGFDLLICDIALPDGTGIDVLRALRGAGRTRGLAVSGFGSNADVQRSIDAGFDAHLTKPVTYQKLHDAISRIYR